MRALVIADKQEITRWGVRQLADLLGGFQTVEEVTSKKKLQAYLNKHPQSVVVLDYNLFDFVSFDELLRYTAEFEQTDWILFSDDFSDLLLKQLLVEKALFSATLKTDSLFQIRTALELSLKKQRYTSEIIADKISNYARFSGKADRVLTNSEREILKEIASGKMTKVIALEKNLSIHTITTHRKNIFKKLEINNVHDAIRYAIRAGIIERDDYTI
ncbi:DNA-binding response regulator [Flavobacterium sp. JP2137]|uniref:response regulator transcription factor n=1 Tax=Flavobacterium sp. JP2137 TaxID=3414510 RepID=UPI003D2FFA04